MSQYKDIPIYVPSEKTVQITPHTRPVDAATYIQRRASEGSLYEIVFPASAADKAVKAMCILTHTTLERNRIILTFHLAYFQIHTHNGVVDVTVASPIYNEETKLD